MDKECVTSKQDIVRLVKKYGEARKQCRWVEVNRPSFLKTGLKGLNNYMEVGVDAVCKEIDGRIMSPSDKNILKNYVRGREIMAIVETAIHERIDKQHLDIAEDIFFEGMTIRETSKKHKVSESTVRRVRNKGIEVISDEIMFLLGAGRDVSNVFM